jgi:hypothetical protein
MKGEPGMKPQMNRPMAWQYAVDQHALTEEMRFHSSEPTCATLASIIAISKTFCRAGS